MWHAVSNAKSFTDFPGSEINNSSSNQQDFIAQAQPLMLNIVWKGKIRVATYNIIQYIFTLGRWAYFSYYYCIFLLACTKWQSLNHLRAEYDNTQNANKVIQGLFGFKKSRLNAEASSFEQKTLFAVFVMFGWGQSCFLSRNTTLTAHSKSPFTRNIKAISLYISMSKWVIKK